MNAPKPFVGLVDFKLYVDDSLMELRVQGPPLRFPVDADAIGEALADGLRGILHCKPKAEAEPTPLTGTSEVADAARFRWLCEDHLNDSDRAARDAVLQLIMGHFNVESAARKAVDAAMHGWGKPEPGK